jgi:ribosomal protein S18 acetylase RimI-like enzyme
MKPEIIIREFHLSDYDSVLKLWDEAGLTFRPQGRDSRQRIGKELRQGHSIFLVAEAKDNIVGTLLGTQDGRKGWLNRLAVAKGFRKQGLARQLVTEVESRFDKLSLDVIACLIEGENTTSMEVFTQL